MTTKIRIKVGEVEVEYEGAEAFLNKKLPELIGQLSKLAEHVPAAPSGDAQRHHPPGRTAGTLASFLEAKSAKANQLKRFLATAEWLHLRGAKRLKVGDITRALKENSQSRLGNPSDCLAKNVGKGHCEKDGREFFVTDDGRSALG